MRQDFFEFVPQFKLMIVGNHKPILRNVDDAARRRFLIVPFERKPEVPDTDLEQKLMAEAAGILRWMIEGCLDWQKNGLVRPSTVLDATNRYFEEQDLLSQWIADECDLEPGNKYKTAPVGTLFGAWSEYCRSSGELPGISKAFGNDLEKRGCTRGKVQGVRVFIGIRLRGNQTEKGD
jgi:putative DNA primase/helicase